MRKAAVLLLCCIALPAWPQDNLAEDPILAIGLTLAMAHDRYGVPDSVYAVRGAEDWQDDVVFVYKDLDLYIYQDRVWQVGLKSAMGISLGDPGGVATLVLGDGVQAYNGYLIYSLPPRSWPMELRVNLDAAGKVSAIFIYRSDY